jgi:3-methylcrotonyl-CoA carboxylase beta subunit
MSAQGIPQIAVVMGSCTAGGAYVPAMSDESIIVKNQGTIFLGGPPLVKAATGEVVSAEDLGGGDVHTRLSGVADHLAQNDTMRWRWRARRSANLNWPSPRCDAAAAKLRSTPEELHGVIPPTRASPSTCARSSPASSTARASTSSRRATAPPWSPASRASMACRWASSPTTASCSVRAAQKGAHFIELCCQRKIPLVFLQNITGFMVGRKYENEGIAKRRRQDGDRGGHGPGAEVHHDHRRQLRCRQLRHVRPRLQPALAVDVAQRAHQRDGRRAGRQRCWPPSSATAWKPRARQWSKEDEEAFKAPIRASTKDQGHPYYATARLWDDGVIDPADTRRVLSASLNAPGPSGVFRM